MTMVRWTPFRDLNTLHTRMNRLLGDSVACQGEETGRTWSPAVDIFEQGDDLVLRAEVPGVSSDDLDLHVEGNILTIRGERRQEKEIKDESYHRMERSYGPFSRSFTLPNTVDATRIDARYQDGVLEVKLPKAEEAKPKRIEVKAS